MEKQYAYIARCIDGTIYVGCTNNLQRRIKDHNCGKVKSTAYRRPIKILSYLVFSEKHKAYFFEKYLKTVSGRAFLNKRLI